MTSRTTRYAMFGRELCVALMPFWNTFRASVLLRNTFILGFELPDLYTQDAVIRNRMEHGRG